MIHKKDKMLFCEFIDHLKTLGDDQALVEAWVESLPARDRRRMLQTYATFTEALEGSEVARRNVRRILRQEDRALEQRNRRCQF